MRTDPHPFRHGGLWWRIATVLAVGGPHRFGLLFRVTRAHARPRAEEKARFQHAVRAMTRVGLTAHGADGFSLTAHGVRELARLDAEAQAHAPAAANMRPAA